MRALRLAAPLILAAGCVFDPAVPAELAVSCVRDEDCLGGRICRTPPGRCVFPRDDSEAPRFADEPKMTPRAAREGVTLELTFSVTEELVRAPAVRLVAPGGQRAMGLDEAQTSPGDRRWVFSTVALGTDGEGAASLVVDMEDLAGNEVTGLLASVATLDFTAPDVPANQVSIQPSVARSGTAVTVLALASEALAPGARLRARAGAQEVEVAPVLADGASLTFSLPTGGLAGHAEAVLEVVGLEDLAGNRAGAVSIGTLTLDDEAPALSPLDVATPLVSRQVGRDVVRFSFSVAGADRVAALVGTLDAACDVDGGFHACTFVPPSGQAEGPSGVVVRAEDRAGNLSEARGQVTFDFTPPEVISGSVGLQILPAADNALFRPAQAGPGATAQLGFTLSEPVLMASVEGGGLAWAQSQQSGTSWLFAATVPASGATEGSVVPVVSAVDGAGNSATRPLALAAPGLVVDVTAPAPLGLDGGLMLRRFPFGAELTNGVPRTDLSGAPGAAEPRAVVRIFAFGNPLAGELLRVQVDDAGGFANTRVADMDLADPWVEQIDLAGNRSPPEPIREHEWIISFSRQNPRRPVLQTLSGRFAHPNYPEAQPGSLDAPDDAGLRVEGQGRLIDVARRGSLTYSGASAPAPVYDSARGHLLAFGPHFPPPATERDVARWDGDRWWLEQSLDPESDGDPALDGSNPAALVDGAELGLWAFEESGAAWRWTGGSWSRALDAGAGGPVGAATWAFDGQQRRFLAVSSSGDGGLEVRSFDGAAVRPVSLLDPEGDGNPQRRPRFSATSLTDGRVYFYAEALSGHGELWAWAGGSFARLGSSLPAVTAGTFLLEPISDTPIVFSPSLSAARWTGTSWQAVSTSDPEGDGEPTSSSPSPGVDTGAQRIIATSLGKTWAWTGSSWKQLHAPYAGGNVLNPGGGRFSPLAYANPAVRQVEVCGGGGYSGPIYPDCVRWDGFAWYRPDGGNGFRPNGYQGSAAVAPDGTAGLLITGSADGGAATFVFLDGGWVERDGAGVVTSSHASWAPLVNGYYHLQTTGDFTAGRTWSGAAWLPFESAANDAGTLSGSQPFWGQQVLSWDPKTSALVKFGSGNATWVRRSGGWSQLSGDPEGDGEAWGGCLVTSAASNTLYAISTDLWEFTGQSWTLLRSAPVVATEGLWPGIFGCFAAWDPWRQQVIASNWGNDVHAWDPALNERPAIELSVPFSLGGFASTAVVIDARVKARLGGDGQLGGANRPGAELAVWSDGRWLPFAQSTAPAASPDWVAAAATPALPWARAGLAPRGTYRLLVRPRGTNGPGKASVFLDYAEVSVRVRRQ